MTREEFEQGYAARSHTVEALHELGRYAHPCGCGERSCQGWQMGHLPWSKFKELIDSELMRQGLTQNIGVECIDVLYPGSVFTIAVTVDEDSGELVVREP